MCLKARRSGASRPGKTATEEALHEQLTAAPPVTHLLTCTPPYIFYYCNTAPQEAQETIYDCSRGRSIEKRYKRREGWGECYFWSCDYSPAALQWHHWYWGLRLPVCLVIYGTSEQGPSELGHFGPALYKYIHLVLPNALVHCITSDKFWRCPLLRGSLYPYFNSHVSVPSPGCESSKLALSPAHVRCLCWAVSCPTFHLLAGAQPRLRYIISTLKLFSEMCLKQYTGKHS